MSLVQNEKVLIFSPFAYIWVHALPEIQLGGILARNNISVSLWSCTEDFQEHCTAMSAAGVEINDSILDKKKICGYCIKLRKYTKEIPGINFLRLNSPSEINSSFLIPEKFVDKIALKIGNIEIGKIALYETLIKYKKVNTDLSESESLHFEYYLRAAIKTYFIGTKVLEAEKPDVVICYSPQYVVPGTFAAVAKSLNIPVIFAEGSSIDVERYSHLRLWNWEEYGLTQPAMDNSDFFEKYVPSNISLKRAKRQLASKNSSKTFSVYSVKSKGLDPRDFFGLDSNKKTYLMAMSSYDEVYSGYVIGKLPKVRFKSEVFKDQVEWLSATLDWFSHHTEFQLIVRPHPREFPNKRDGHSSEHHKAWNQALENLPSNVRLDHPSLEFSLFDHLKNIDVFVTGWSSAGVEALAHGIPVVTYDSNLPTFSPSIHYTGTTRQKYFENLLEAGKSGKSSRNQYNALRWIAYTAEFGTVNVGGRITDRLGLSQHLKISRLINSRYLAFLVKRLELRISSSHKDDRRILDLISGKSKSLFPPRN